MPEESSQHVFGLEIDFLVEGDGVDILFAVGTGARRLAVVIEPFAELVGNGELFGIGEIQAREDQDSALLQSLAKGDHILLVEEMLLGNVDAAADVRLDLLDTNGAHDRPPYYGRAGSHC